MSTINLNNFWSRTLTGAIFVAAIVGSILYSQFIFAILFLIVSLLSLSEFFGLLNAGKKIRVQVVPGLISSTVLYISLALVSLDYIGKQYLLINLLLPVMIFIFELYQKNDTPIQNIALTLLGILYIGLPFSLLNLFFNPELIPGEYHPGVLLGFFVIIWAYDSFAYLTGMLFGRHRLFPRISPKKSWEGTIGGFVFGLLAAFILSNFFSEFDLINWLIIAAITMIFSTFGDLSESMLKRSLNIKDSGKVLPGHGGFLDRFDAVLLAAPAVFVYMNIIYHI
ncbi:MAG: phosphatidate cytidylyltransferase [Bacteroidales bacterium]|nr:phosphatidate cytidylyltransferase [Bacteroidales bacterium]